MARTAVQSKAKPRFATCRTDRPTAGGEAAKVAAELGQALLPWQRQVLDVGLEYEHDGDFPLGRRYVYREVAFGTPRQSGKSYLLLIKFLHRLILMGEQQRALYSMQTGADAARKLLDDWVPTILESSLRAALMPGRGVRRSVGSEMVQTRTRSTLEILRNTKASGHGRTIDEAALDEVMADIDDRREQAVVPAMLTRLNAQLIITSTAGTDESLYWRRKVDFGRQAVENGEVADSCYFEWSAEDGVDPYDEQVWWDCMPALGLTQPIGAVRHAAKSMQEHEFRRAMLNQWTRTDDKIIDWTAWVECRSTRGAISSEMMLAFDVNKERTSASICAASLGSDGMIDVEVVQREQGTGWLVSRMVELRDHHNPLRILVDGSGPAGALIPEMERAGIDLHIVTTSEMPKAAGAFYDRVMERRLRVRPSDALDDAVAGAAKRIRGDSFVWARSTLANDISPLVCATLATWGVAGDPNHGAMWIY